MPGIKPTNEELERRALAVLDRMVSGHSKSAIVMMARSSWGVDHRTAFRYMARASKILSDSANLPLAEMRTRAMGFYESVMRDGKASHRDKIRAQERIDKLFGLEAPTRTEVTGHGGGPIRTKSDDDRRPVTTEELAPVFADILREIAADRNR